MNFLAHLFLSGQNEDILIGNFIADFLNLKEVNKYPKTIQNGIQIHREIDHFTDNHPLVRKGIKRLFPYHHKYSPVVIDILYDYLLAVNWKRYHSFELDHFAQEAYEIVRRRIDEMPTFLQKYLPLMIADNFLLRYGTLDGLEFTFEKLQNRVSKPEHLENAVESLLRDYEDLNEEFNVFFPEIIDYIKPKLLSFEMKR
ncbi:MAG: DUF479 domain-containing protein [Bacteroidetes bacterium]|nr:DUF479 domain-containing protein [Bacteroidota bacterium]